MSPRHVPHGRGRRVPRSVPENHEPDRRAATTIPDGRLKLAQRSGARTAAFLNSELKQRLTSLKRHVVRLEAEIARRIASDPKLARRIAIINSIPGIDPVAAAMLITGLAELAMAALSASAARPTGD